METANSVGVALRQQPRDDLLPRIELTPDQLTPPRLEREEQAIGHNSAHDAALKRLRDHLLLELDEESPGLYAKCVRGIDAIKAYFGRATSGESDAQPFGVSIAEPDKLGTADVSAKDDVAQWLMRKKQQSVAVLAGHIRDHTLSPHRRRHAAETFELISGRRFHGDKIADAQKVLALHGQ